MALDNTYVKYHYVCNWYGEAKLVLLQVRFNLLKTKRRLLYLKTQFVPRSKHFSSRL